MHNRIKWLIQCSSLIVCLGLTACGGNDGNDSNGDTAATNALSDDQSGVSNAVTLTPPPTEPSARGDWKHTELLAEHDLANIKRSGSTLSPDIPLDSLRYAVRLHRISYTTTDGAGHLINVSAALALPAKNPQLASPILSYQHGTIFRNAEAPSNDTGADAPPVLLAALGYIVVAADYVGYGISQGTPHPYLQKEPAAHAVIDLIKAARFWLTGKTIAFNKQLFLTGYSQGGHATMAAHQAIEATNDAAMRVTASIPGAGPYHMVATLNDLTAPYRFRQQDQASINIINEPGTAQRLAPAIAEPLANLVIAQVVPADSDISFANTVIYDYLRTDGEATAAENVHDWRAIAPVRLHHGRGDTTVPFRNATDALTAMQARGSTDVLLTECLTTPADHRNCIPPYGLFITHYFGGLAQGL